MLNCFPEQVEEQILQALGIRVCGDFIAHRGLLAALYSEVKYSYFLRVGLGIGSTTHGDPLQAGSPCSLLSDFFLKEADEICALQEGEVGRKGISVERTFENMSDKDAQEAKVSPAVSSLL